MSAHPTPEQLGAYLDGELDAPVRAAVDVHLRECGECAAHLADLTAVDDAARAVPLEVPEGYFEDFAPRVRARLAKKAPSRWRPPAWGWAAAAAVLLAVITPLALQEQRLAAPTMAKRAEPPPPPAAAADGRLEQDTRAGAKQDQGFARLTKSPAAAPPATIAAAPAPAPSVAAPERAAESRLGRRDQGDAPEAGGDEAAIQPAKREASPEQGLADAARSKEELTDAQLDNRRALGDTAPAPPEEREAQDAAKAPGAGAAPAAPAAAPPVASQRQYGPRAQNTVPSEGRAEERKAAKAVAAKDKGQAGYAADEPAAAAGTVTGALQESVEVTGRSLDVGQGAAWAKYRSLADSPPPRSDGDARLLREAWRSFADENPGHPQADEARVRVVEAGALAYRLGRRPQDREIAMRDGRAYLERPVSPRADRVRAVLKTLEPDHR